MAGDLLQCKIKDIEIVVIFFLNLPGFLQATEADGKPFLSAKYKQDLHGILTPPSAVNIGHKSSSSNC